MPRTIGGLLCYVTDMTAGSNSPSHSSWEYVQPTEYIFAHFISELGHILGQNRNAEICSIE